MTQTIRVTPTGGIDDAPTINAALHGSDPFHPQDGNTVILEGGPFNGATPILPAPNSSLVCEGRTRIFAQADNFRMVDLSPQVQAVARSFTIGDIDLDANTHAGVETLHAEGLGPWQSIASYIPSLRVVRLATYGAARHGTVRFCLQTELDWSMYDGSDGLVTYDAGLMSIPNLQIIGCSGTSIFAEGPTDPGDHTAEGFRTGYVLVDGCGFGPVFKNLTDINATGLDVSSTKLGPALHVTGHCTGSGIKGTFNSIGGNIVVQIDDAAGNPNGPTQDLEIDAQVWGAPQYAVLMGSARDMRLRGEITGSVNADVILADVQRTVLDGLRCNSPNTASGTISIYETPQGVDNTVRGTRSKGVVILSNAQTIANSSDNRQV